MKYTEILRENSLLKKQLKSESYKISILSNITVNQLKEILEYELRRDALNANVIIGDYDNIVQDSFKYNNSNLVIVFWELCNLIEGLQYKIDLMTDSEYDELLNQTKSEIDIVIENLKSSSLVLFNKFSSLPFTFSMPGNPKMKTFAQKLNNYLEKKIQSNILLIDFENVLAKNGINNSIDLRYFYSSKALYTLGTFINYSSFIKPYVFAATGKAKKALIFDCDNTLWKGILGEDGFDGIEMSSKTKNGAIFSEIQNIALSLVKRGIIIGLCSKNNYQDVQEVIEKHPDIKLKNEDITIKKINWKDKVSNLNEIAKELNIGLDSIVFVDDSSFEVNFVKKEIPEIKVLQVPKNLYEYPELLRKNLGLFFNLSMTKEDFKKIQMYKQQVKRQEAEKNFKNLDNYLESLGLKVTINVDNPEIVPRMAQMTQKTNQFNLTTKRYTETDIKNFVENSKYRIIAISVSDNFGDSGITGLAIVELDKENKEGIIDSLLMSCRIIGRKIEFAFMDIIIETLSKENIKVLKANYLKTLKNEQVSNYYEKCAFELIDNNNQNKYYKINMNNYKYFNINYIEKNYERKN
jgi:FkbH-like protein